MGLAEQDRAERAALAWQTKFVELDEECQQAYERAFGQKRAGRPIPQILYELGRSFEQYQRLLDSAHASERALEKKLSDRDVPEGEWRSRFERLECAVKKHRDARGHDRCWLDDQELYAALGESIDPKDFALPPACEFLERCIEYWRIRKSAEVDSSRRRASDG